MIFYEKHVCELEQAKQLRNLGLLQESFCYHVKIGDYYQIVCSPCTFYDVELAWSAWMCDEILRVLPSLIEADDTKKNTGLRQWELFCGKDVNDGFFCGYFNASICHPGKFLFVEYGDNPSIACTQMLLYLISKKIITIEAINEINYK